MPPVRLASAASPCIGICRLEDRSGLCIGCFRTIQEIARWGALAQDERARIFAALAGRRNAVQLGGGAEVGGAAGVVVDLE